MLIIDGLTEALLISTQGWESRGITEPKTEAVVRGSREGFTETFPKDLKADIWIKVPNKTMIIPKKPKNPAKMVRSIRKRAARSD
ncbi:MAG: spore germination protein [Bacillota bacterium]